MYTILDDGGVTMKRIKSLFIMLVMLVCFMFVPFAGSKKEARAARTKVTYEE